MKEISGKPRNLWLQQLGADYTDENKRASGLSKRRDERWNIYQPIK